MPYIFLKKLEAVYPKEKEILYPISIGQLKSFEITFRVKS